MAHESLRAVAAQLQRMRIDADVSVPALAAEWGYSPSAVYKWFNGTAPMPDDLLGRFLAKVDASQADRDLLRGMQLRQHTLRRRRGRPARSDRYVVPVLAKKVVHLDEPLARLAGRESLFVEIQRQLAAAATAPSVVVLSGLGGVGKTSAAVGYAAGHKDTYGLIWQLRAEDSAVLAADLTELARTLCPNSPLTADPISQAHQALATVDCPWMLLYDNATTPHALAGMLPPAGNGHILITSQHPNWPQASGLSVPVLDRIVSADFLRTRVRTSDPDDTFVELADLLGCLPLALEQAAAFMSSTGTGPVRYLRRLDDLSQADGLFRRGGPRGYPWTVATTWGTAIRQLFDMRPEAITLLRLFAFCAPDAIPFHLVFDQAADRSSLAPTTRELLGGLLRDQFAVDDAMTALLDLSLISPPSDGMVSVHRLVQAVTRDQLSNTDRAQWCAAAADLIRSSIPPQPHEQDSWDSCARLFPHAVTMLADDPATIAQLVAYLGHYGNYRQAITLQQGLIKRSSDHNGGNHPATLNAKTALAQWIGEAGDPRAAHRLLAEVLPVQVEQLGASDPATLITMHQLAHWAGVLDQITEAVSLYTEVVRLRTIVLGPHDPATLASRHNLTSRLAPDDPAWARDEFARVYALRADVLGPSHMGTLMSRHEHANWTGLAGDPVRARDMYQQLLPVWREACGPDHPDTMIAEAQIALWVGRAGDPAAARDAYAALYPRRVKVLGERHPTILHARSEQEHCIGLAGDPDGARIRLTETLALLSEILGPEHGVTIHTRERLAYWTTHR